MKIQKNESVIMSFEGRKEILLLNRILTALLEDKVGFKNNLLNIGVSVLHHDFSFLSQVAFILRGLRRIFDLS